MLHNQLADKRIQYGYTPNGSYAPQSIGGQHIDYGYNYDGSYLPRVYWILVIKKDEI